MNAQVIRAARNIPEHLRSLVASMFEADRNSLRSNLSALRSSLRLVGDFAESAEKVFVGSEGPAVATRVAAVVEVGEPAAPRQVRRRRSKRFGIGVFIVELLGKHSKGLEPKAISRELKVVSPTGYKDHSAAVHTTLARLREAGKVSNKNGIWTLKK